MLSNIESLTKQQGNFSLITMYIFYAKVFLISTIFIVTLFYLEYFARMNQNLNTK